ncbi:unnamed protein product [Mytilus coruscus]|uniref:Helicase ATP-binding domain-containing protein n=1 Tax=Mytilus coruscus TaxID=42192 RepID=A0A6J8AW74_MYTCO|nr:unnamed protein product [Mytilus coruscus]
MSLVLEIEKGYGDSLKSKYTYILCHPGDILKKEICDILCSDSWQKEVSHIFIDEVHCVLQWGHEFRPDYMKISKLRSVFSDAKFVALTATATKLVIKKNTDNLQMKCFTIISAFVDRPNVKISVIKRLPSAEEKNTAEDSFGQVMEPVVRSLCSDPSKFPKTIIYSKLKSCANGKSLDTYAPKSIAGQYVAVAYIDIWYPGQILSVKNDLLAMDQDRLRPNRQMKEFLGITGHLILDRCKDKNAKIITDNAPNMTKAFDISVSLDIHAILRDRILSQTVKITMPLQLVVKDGLKEASPHLKTVISKASNTVKYARKSKNASYILKGGEKAAS